ncbi:hypothetical protein BGAL_0337g00080 [Botrytis galanthina]|uniref:Uncharacterized protein n=1 Tax=Botrytis galanthina TaxID=278940 RepID=A0A4S8R1Q0_9HELO|nr:hypothetical protein BGAL_0337g00080 [Botrytis galanthina]
MFDNGQILMCLTGPFLKIERKLIGMAEYALLDDALLGLFNKKGEVYNICIVAYIKRTHARSRSGIGK